MNNERHTLKILIAVFMTVFILGGGFLGWLYYCNSLSLKQTAGISSIPARTADPTQAEINDIQSEIQKSDDIDISDIDNTSELDKIDLSGI